jgi:hypothetical protein
MKSKHKTQFGLSALALATLVLAGCGGGGGGSVATSMSGSVIDGYIEGATVCLDINANLACDSGEPSAITAKDGSYKLDTSALTTAQIQAAHLLTVVPVSAKDADDAGKTLAEAGKSGFSLLAPAAAYVTAAGTVTGAVISPLTTLVAHDIITSQTTLATAQANVRARLGLESGVDLTQDFVAKKDAGLSEKAQMLTVALGSVKAQALAVKDTSDKDALLTAVQYLQTQFTQLKAEFDAAKKASPNAKPVDLVKTALATDAAKPVVATLLADAKKTTSSTASSALALIEQGFYSADHVLEVCRANDSYCNPYYSKIQGSGGKITLDSDYELNASGAWEKVTSSDSNLALTSKGWVKENDCAPGQSPTYSADGSGVTTVTFCAGTTERITARTVDAAGKTLSALGLKPPTGFEKTTMPAGSELYWLNFANTDDKYDLWMGSPVQNWDSQANRQVTYSTLADYIAAYTTSPSSGSTASPSSGGTASPSSGGTASPSSGGTASPSSGSTPYTTWSGLYYSFNAGGTPTGGTVSLWRSWSYDPVTKVSTSPAVIGQAKYSIRTVHGQQLLVIEAPAPENDRGELVMFAVKDGYLYGGSVRLASAKGSADGLFNKTMINAILAAGKKPAVKD